MRPGRVELVKGLRTLLAMTASLLVLAAPVGAAEIADGLPQPGAFAGKKTALVFFHPF